MVSSGGPKMAQGSRGKGSGGDGTSIKRSGKNEETVEVRGDSSTGYPEDAETKRERSNDVSE